MASRPTASVLFQSGPHYQPDAFSRGLERLGYALAAINRHPAPGDVLVLWNRRPPFDREAVRHERAGARVIIAENGYLWPAGSPKRYALALDQHNGAGVWPEGDGSRWASLGVELKPWRESGEQLLLLPQRGIGPRGVAMPGGWTADVIRDLRSSRRRIDIRRHPGPDKTEPYEALRGAHAAITWGSGAAIKALSVGIPVFYEFPRWIGAAAARFGLGQLEDPYLGDREPMFRRLAWAQWTLAEIESGEAFAWLLETGRHAATASSPPP